MRLLVAPTVVFALLTSVALAEESKPTDANARVERGKQALKKKEYEKAIQDFTEAIRLDPKNAEAFVQRGQARSDSGDWFNAIRDFREAIELDPTNASAYYGRGFAELTLGWNEKAIDDFTEVIKLDPKFPSAYYLRGRVRAKIDKPDEALTDLTAAIKLDPKHAEAFHARGMLRVQHGEPDQAIDDLTESIRLAPKTALAYCNRGYAYTQQGNFDKALDDLNTAIQLDPQNAEFFSQRSECRMSQLTASLSEGDKYLEGVKAATKDAEEAVRLAPKDAKMRLKRGRLYEMRLNWEAARADYDEAIRLSPNNASVLMARARVLTGCPEPKHRDSIQAYKDADRACELTEWKDPFALETLAMACSAIGDFGAAIKWQKKALEDSAYAKIASQGQAYLELYEAKKPFRIEFVAIETSAEGFASLAFHWVQNGEYEKAIRCCNDALRLDPKHVTAHLVRGYAYSLNKDLARSVSDLTEAIKLAPKNPAGHYLRSVVLATRGEWERALADCDEVLKLDPKFSLALAIRAEIRAGCPDEKFRSAKKALQDARQACELTNWKDAAGLMAYAAACAEAGDFAEAARWQVQAMKDEAYMTGHAAHARDRLEMYRNRQPLRLAAEKKSE